MLRWCLSTVRNLGGRSNASTNVACPISIARHAIHLRHNPRSRSALDTPAALPGHSSYNIVENPTLTLAQVQEHARLCDQPHTCHEQTSDPSAAMPSFDDPDHGYPIAPLPASSMSCPDLSPTLSGTAETACESPLPRLKHLLSTMTSCDAPQTLAIYTTNTLRSLYLAAKANAQLHELSSAQMSSLIALFGTLSSSTTDQLYTSIHAHPGAAKVRRKGGRHTYWPFVLELGSEKSQLTQAFSDSDHFWLMQAHLALHRWKDTDEAAACQAAVTHYRQLCQSSSHPAIHASFIQMLLRSSAEHGFLEAANALVQFFETFPRMHSCILDLFWRLVIEGSAHLSIPTRARILLAVSRRSAREMQSMSLASGQVLSDDVEPIGDNGGWGVEELAGALTVALSGTASRQARIPISLRIWALRFMQTSFAVDLSDPASVNAAWSSLMLLALASGASPGATSSRISANFQASDWQTLCVLVQLERLIHARKGRVYNEPCAMKNGDAIRSVVTTLWTRWLARRSLDSDSVVLQSVLIGSFLYISGRVGASDLLDACREQLEVQMAVSRPAEPSMSAAATRDNLVEYCVASLRCGQQLQEILEWLSQHTKDPSTVIHGALDRIIPADPVLAYELYVCSSQFNIAIGGSIIGQLGKHLANGGFVHIALECVRQPGLRIQEQTEILEALVRLFAKSTEESAYGEYWDELCNVILELLPCATFQPFRLLVERAIISLLESDRVHSAVPLITTSMQLSENLIFSWAGQTIVDLLLQHRQFRVASDLFNRITRTKTTSSRWQANVIAQLARGGAHRIASEVATQTQSLPDGPTTMLRAAGYRYFSPSDPAALRIRRLLARPKLDQAGIMMGVQLLIAAKRVNNARAFFQREHTRLLPDVRTAIGNELIHAHFRQPARPSPHRMKGALRVLKDLTAECQFVPDRVTMNILMKGLLQWETELDRQGVRALFDRLVLSGYPTGGLYDPGVAPFGSTFSDGDSTMPLPQVTSPIMFEKHVRPLYKMFIKGMYVRKDVNAARKVVGILQAAEAEWKVGRLMGRSS